MSGDHQYEISRLVERENALRDAVKRAEEQAHNVYLCLDFEKDKGENLPEQRRLLALRCQAVIAAAEALSRHSDPSGKA